MLENFSAVSICHILILIRLGMCECLVLMRANLVCNHNRPQAGHLNHTAHTEPHLTTLPTLDQMQQFVESLTLSPLLQQLSEIIYLESKKMENSLREFEDEDERKVRIIQEQGGQVVSSCAGQTSQ